VVTSTVSILCCTCLKSVSIHTLYLCLLYDSLNRVIFSLNNCNWFVSLMDVDRVGYKVWIELVCIIWMNVSLQRVEFGIFPTWLTVFQLMDENHKDINITLAEVNVCLILLRDYMTCTHLWSYYFKSFLRYCTGTVPQNYINPYPANMEYRVS
jgi:hypothetical protein